MLDWFLALEDGNKITIVIFLLGTIWALFKAYYKWVKPKPIPEDPTPTLKMTLDEFEARIKAKIKDALKEREHATGKDLDIKNAQIAALRTDLANIKEAFEKQNQFIASLETQLLREGNTIGGDALEKATQALEAGDTTLAQSQFEEIKVRTALDVEASARASFALGKIAEQDYRWQDAFAHYREAAHLHPTYAHLIRAQSSALQIANYPEAESLAKTALKAADQEFGKTAPEYGTALNNLASLLRATGRFEEAEPLFQRALETTRVALGEDHPEFGTRLNNLAGLLEATGRFEEAEPLYRQALENTRVALGEDHPSFGIRLNNFAELLRATGRFEDAEPLYRQALENARVALGENHPEFGTSLNNLAELLRATGRFEDAEPLYRQALENARAALGEDHPEFGTSLNNLAGLLEATGRFEDAEPLYRQAVENTRVALGEDHPSFGTSLNNLAGLLYVTGRYEDAEPLYRQAVAVFEKSLGPDHPSTKTVKTNYEHFLANRSPAD